MKSEEIDIDSRRHQLLIQAWEVITAERELHGVLAAMAELLLPRIPFNSLAIVKFEGETHDLYALHIVGTPQMEGETLDEFKSRLGPYPVREEIEPRPRLRYEDLDTDWAAGQRVALRLR